MKIAYVIAGLIVVVIGNVAPLDNNLRRIGLNLIAISLLYLGIKDYKKPSLPQNVDYKNIPMKTVMTSYSMFVLLLLITFTLCFPIFQRWNHNEPVWTAAYIGAWLLLFFRVSYGFFKRFKK